MHFRYKHFSYSAIPTARYASVTSDRVKYRAVISPLKPFFCCKTHWAQLWLYRTHNHNLTEFKKRGGNSDLQRINKLLRKIEETFQSKGFSLTGSDRKNGHQWEEAWGLSVISGNHIYVISTPRRDRIASDLASNKYGHCLPVQVGSFRSNVIWSFWLEGWWLQCKVFSVIKNAG